MTLVDTNILLDVLTADPTWLDWSRRQLRAASISGSLFINDIIYAELSVGARRIEDVDEFLQEVAVEMLPVPREALFMAGKAFAHYRSRGGARTGVLPDFFIGAQAAVTGLPLLTRDPRRYRTYFPRIALTCP